MGKPRIPFGANAVSMGFATPQQVEEALEYQRRQRSKGKHVLLGLAMRKLGFLSRDQMLKILGQSQHSEFTLSEDAIPLAVRIKTALGNGKRVVALTGTAEREGVSTIAFQIALALALMEEGQTLLVDANFRSPSINRYVLRRRSETESGDGWVKGLSDLLLGQAEPAQAIVPSDVPTLSLLPTGNPAVDFLSLLLSDEYARLLEALRADYRYVIVDAPPLLKYPDTAILASRADGVVFVVAKGWHTRSDVLEMQRALDALKVPLLGVVLCDRSLVP